MIRFFAPIWSRRELIGSLAKRDLSGRYAGSMLGIVWTLIHPIVMITIYWFVFSVGFKAQPLMNIPFVIWLTAGMLPWLFFTEVISSTTSSLVESASFIKKTVFPAQVLVFSKVIAALFTHCILGALLFVLLWAYGISVSILSFQVFYYLPIAALLGIGIGWGVSSLNVFVRDVSQFVSVALQVWFWLTPIFWDIHIMPEWVQSYLKLNPMFYVVQGYRDSILFGVPVTADVTTALFFCSISLLVFFTGAKIFKRLQPHFGDVL